MKKQTDPDIEKFQALLREMYSTKAQLSDPQSPRRSVMLDGFFSCIANLSQPSPPVLTPKHGERLLRLIQCCRTHQAPADELQAAAMEIGVIAPAEHADSVDALSGLLNHENRHVRINACQSLGRIGGKEAEQLLEPLVKSNDPELKRAANEATYLSKMALLAEHIRAFAQELPVLREQTRQQTAILEERYRAQTLFLCSGGFLIAFLATLIGWYWHKVLLIHPAISMVGVISSGGFVVLSAWRWKWK